MKKVLAYLQLIRAANIVTAISNIWAGAVIASSGGFIWDKVIIGSIASAALYAGGVTLNNYCDRKADSVNYPKRPIPSGMIQAKTALILAVIWLVIGAGLGFFISRNAGIISCAIAISAVLYNISKHSTLAGLTFMGLCRGLNWVLGLIVGGITNKGLLFIPIAISLYIVLITAISRQEEKSPSLRKLVKLGIVIIPLIDGAIVMSFGYYWPGFVIMALIIPTIILGKIFEIT